MNVVRITVCIDSDTRSTSNLNTQMGACDNILWKKCEWVGIKVQQEAVCDAKIYLTKGQQVIERQ